MVAYFPNVISRKAMTFYFVTLAIVSVLFMRRILPFVWMVFGAVEVCTFFYFSNDLTKRWGRLHPEVFVKKLFWTALLIRLVYMVFAFFFYTAMTGQPFMFYSADEQVYFGMSKVWKEQGFEALRNGMKGFGVDDSGEIYLTGFLCWIFGTSVFPARVLHSLLSALTCVLVYRLAKRHFGESTGRMAAIFCMLMPNLVYYCGIHLKEADMLFFTVLFVDRVDLVLSEKGAGAKNIVFAFLAGFALFTFRSVLGAVGLIAMGVAIVFTKGKLGSWWKRIVLVVLVGAALTTTNIGLRIMSEVDTAWSRRESNQEEGMQYRATREGGNVFAKYASGAVFAPFIFTIPFPTLVNTEGQENQQMLNGGNFVKNVLSGFTLFALVLLLLSGEWRKHTLPIAMMGGYLAVIAFSNFAQSERFHQPALPFELMFAAFGISQLKAKHVKWIDYWMYFVVAANVGWAWFKLAGRGLV